MCLRINIKRRKYCAELWCDRAMDILNLSFDIYFKTTKERNGQKAFALQSPVSRQHSDELGS